MNGKLALMAFLLLLLAVSAAAEETLVASLNYENQTTLVFSTGKDAYAASENHSTQVFSGSVSAIVADSIIDGSMPFILLQNETGIVVIGTYKISKAGKWAWGFKRPLQIAKSANITLLRIGRQYDHAANASTIFFENETGLFRIDPKICPCGAVSWEKPELSSRNQGTQNVPFSFGCARMFDRILFAFVP
jgi:hypothetical protein